MKKLTVKGKLSLNKETIAKLTSNELAHANGGATFVTCTPKSGGCPATNGTQTQCGNCCIPPCW